MPQRIRDAQVAEEIAAQAGTDAAPDLFLSDFLSPVIFGPQRPPLATSGYFPGTFGLIVAGVALNTSHAGIAVVGSTANMIVRVNQVSIINQTAGVLIYTFRRVDDETGFTLAPLVPGYINAGTPLTNGVQSAVRSNTVGAQGVAMGQVIVEGNTTQHYDINTIISSGAFVISLGTVNTSLRVFMSYEAWPSIRQQPVGG